MFNYQDNNFIDTGSSMQYEHVGGDFARIPEDAAIIQGCNLY